MRSWCICCSLWALPEYWRQNQSADYFTFYEPVARNLAQGRGLIERDGSPAVRYPPLYPLLLAGIFQTAAGLGIPEALLIRGFSVLMVITTTAPVYSTARGMFGERIALLAGVVWATYPMFVWQTKQPDRPRLSPPCCWRRFT